MGPRIDTTTQLGSWDLSVADDSPQCLRDQTRNEPGRHAGALTKRALLMWTSPG